VYCNLSLLLSVSRCDGIGTINTFVIYLRPGVMSLHYNHLNEIGSERKRGFIPHYSKLHPISPNLYRNWKYGRYLWCIFLYRLILIHSSNPATYPSRVWKNYVSNQFKNKTNDSKVGVDG
jgi:hypothetical protein